MPFISNPDLFLRLIFYYELNFCSAKNWSLCIIEKILRSLCNHLSTLSPWQTLVSWDSVRWAWENACEGFSSSGQWSLQGSRDCTSAEANEHWHMVMPFLVTVDARDQPLQGPDTFFSTVMNHTVELYSRINPFP